MSVSSFVFSPVAVVSNDFVVLFFSVVFSIARNIQILGEVFYELSYKVDIFRLVARCRVPRYQIVGANVG